MHDRISIHEVCFLGNTPAQLADIWCELGAGRVSLIPSTALADNPALLRAALKASGCRAESITHVFTSRPLSSEAAQWRASRTALSQMIEAASRIGAGSIYMLTGGRGTLTWEQAAEAFSDAIAPCVTQARDAGVALMIETAQPLYADCHIAHSLRDAAMLAEMVDIGVCIDLFHCWTEAGLRESMARAMPRCGLIQVSDYVYGDRALPARAVPGDGALPLQQLLGWALDAGYRGAFELELLGPRIEREGAVTAVSRAAQVLQRMLGELGA